MSKERIKAIVESLMDSDPNKGFELLENLLNERTVDLIEIQKVSVAKKIFGECTKTDDIKEEPIEEEERVPGVEHEVGHRVEVHPATDRWMMGDQHGVVTKKVPGGATHVKMDKSGRTFRFHPDNIYRNHTTKKVMSEEDIEEGKTYKDMKDGPKPESKSHLHGKFAAWQDRGKKTKEQDRSSDDDR